MERLRLEARGLVQGVGFRPFVYRLAHELALAGDVHNHPAGVRIEVEGQPQALASFQSRLLVELPAPGRIDSLEVTALPVQGQAVFQIGHSAASGAALALVLPDLATCPACLAELLDPDDRRCGYPFLNCTACGPRFTIIRDLPYDRPQTTMAGFPLCAACAAEYRDPADRRFHAQPTACPVCGPRLTLHGADGVPVDTADPLAQAAAWLDDGRILAVKGLGGYHLACRADQPATVDLLRQRKRREARPLAVMVADLSAAAALADVEQAAAEWLTSPAAPIVLLPRRGSSLAPGIAPGLDTVGLMLAYTPLHHLLLRAVGGPLVMTSANLSDEPIAYQDDDAASRLGGLVDGWLVHDRPIERRCDDSVLRVWRSEPLWLRRSRGMAPAPVPLALTSPSCVLAVGGHQKNTFCLVRGDQAFCSHHLGDLENDLALTAFEQGIADFERLFELSPEWLVCDLHPDYLATVYARERAAREGLPLLAVQHHHAHLAACLADNGRDGEALGIILDGTGLGDDQTIWGGELLLGGLAGYRRVGRLRPFLLAGGEAAVRQGWRVAAELTRQAGLTVAPEAIGVDPTRWELVDQMLAGGFRCLTTSSAGRLFDGFAALLGVAAESAYEGQAAVLLEGCAAGRPEPLPFGLEQVGGLLEVDWRPAVAAAWARVAAGETVGGLAAAFHHGLAEVLTAAAARLVPVGLPVALSGGCFQNVLLLGEVTDRLSAAGRNVLCHRRVPPNDGGLSLGQAAIAAWQVAAGARGDGECV